MSAKKKPAKSQVSVAYCRKQSAIDICLGIMFLFNAGYWWLRNTSLDRLVACLMLLGAVIKMCTAVQLLVSSHYRGQTVTYRLRLFGHTLWQRVVMYGVPTMAAKQPELYLPTIISTVMASALTLLTGIIVLFCLASVVALIRHPMIGDIVPAAIFVAVSGLLIRFNLYCWKRVREDSKRAKIAWHRLETR